MRGQRAGELELLRQGLGLGVVEVDDRLLAVDGHADLARLAAPVEGEHELRAVDLGGERRVLLGAREPLLGRRRGRLVRLPLALLGDLRVARRVLARPQRVGGDCRSRRRRVGARRGAVESDRAGHRGGPAGTGHGHGEGGRAGGEAGVRDGPVPDVTGALGRVDRRGADGEGDAGDRATRRLRVHRDRDAGRRDVDGLAGRRAADVRRRTGSAGRRQRDPAELGTRGRGCQRGRGPQRRGAGRAGVEHLHERARRGRGDAHVAGVEAGHQAADARDVLGLGERPGGAVVAVLVEGAAPVGRVGDVERVQVGAGPAVTGQVEERVPVGEQVGRQPRDVGERRACRGEARADLRDPVGEDAAGEQLATLGGERVEVRGGGAGHGAARAGAEGGGEDPAVAAGGPDPVAVGQRGPDDLRRAGRGQRRAGVRDPVGVDQADDASDGARGRRGERGATGPGCADAGVVPGDGEVLAVRRAADQPLRPGQPGGGERGVAVRRPGGQRDRLHRRSSGLRVLVEEDRSGGVRERCSRAHAVDHEVVDGEPGRVGVRRGQERDGYCGDGRRHHSAKDAQACAHGGLTRKIRR